jgi:tRNA U38,U39,U40 pseudouridine synthase TruA
MLVYMSSFLGTLQGAILQLEVEGTGFLYRQVRNMVILLSCFFSKILLCCFNVHFKAIFLPPYKRHHCHMDACDKNIP